MILQHGRKYTSIAICSEYILSSIPARSKSILRSIATRSADPTKRGHSGRGLQLYSQLQLSHSQSAALWEKHSEKLRRISLPGHSLDTSEKVITSLKTWWIQAQQTNFDNRDSDTKETSHLTDKKSLKITLSGLGQRGWSISKERLERWQGRSTSSIKPMVSALSRRSTWCGGSSTSTTM